MKFCPLNKVDSRYGGKAVGLNNLIKAGLNVPAGLALTPNDLLEILSSSELKQIQKINNFFNNNTKLAVRSSALCEDGDVQSFAGQYKTVLNVKNDIISLFNALKEVYQSSLSKEIQKYSGNRQDAMGVVIQEMVEPKYAGVLFTEATDINGDNCCLIEVVEGLGEKLVSGHANATRIITPYNSSNQLEIADSRIEGKIQDDNIVKTLLDSLNKINNWFKKGMDIEWCIDSNNVAYIVQARPITQHILIPKNSNEHGVIASVGKCSGKTFVIDSDLDDDLLLKEIRKFKAGSILVAPFTDTQYMPAINKAVGIITEEGSLLSHAAIISREKGIPCVVAFNNASSLFPTGTEVSLNTATGEISVGQKIISCESRDIDWESFCIYENKIEEKIIDGCRVIIEKSPIAKADVAIHTPYDVSSQQYNEIEYYIRKTFKQPALFVASEKYLWFDEYQRFLNFKIFKQYLKQAKKICKNRSIEELDNFYKSILENVEVLLSKKSETCDNFERFKIEETLASLHLLVDAIIPDGYGMLSTYKYVNSLNQNFRQFLTGNFNHSNPLLNQCYEFFKSLEYYRNSICQKFVDMGAYSFDYFEDREDRALSAMANLSTSKGVNPIDSFYAEVKKILKVIEINSVTSSN